MKKSIFVFLVLLFLTGCSRGVDFNSETDVAKSFYEKLYNDSDSTDFCADYMYPGSEILCESSKTMKYDSPERDKYKVESAVIDNAYETKRDNQTLVVVTVCYEHNDNCIEYNFNVLLAFVDAKWVVEVISVNNYSNE